ncbi:MAG: hypothetical protein JWN29_1919 [Acidimicrobiales bacterium]|nr:hypothetical protein [Acidimicrobiales bacterium]
MRATGTEVLRARAHRSTSPATDRAAVGLLVTLGGTFLEADKLDHAESALQRAVMTVEAGGHASFRDTVLLDRHLAELERRRRVQSMAACVSARRDAGRAPDVAETDLVRI